MMESYAIVMVKLGNVSAMPSSDLNTIAKYTLVDELSRPELASDSDIATTHPPSIQNELFHTCLPRIAHLRQTNRC